MKRIGVILRGTAVLVVLAGCITQPGIDKDKFAELLGTARDVRTAISTADPCDVPEALAQRLADGIAAAKGKQPTPAEENVIAAYGNLLATYQDGLLFCRLRPQIAHFEFFPTGRVYVSQELDPLVEKYDLPVERHLYKRTGHYLKSIDGKAINVIWESARTQIKNIENMIYYP